MPRKKRFRKSNAQNPIESFASNYNDYKSFLDAKVIDVDIVSIFTKYPNPNKDFICGFLDTGTTLSLQYRDGISHHLGETINGEEKRYNTVGGLFTWTSGSKRRWWIVNDNLHTANTVTSGTNPDVYAIYIGYGKRNIGASAARAIFCYSVDYLNSIPNFRYSQTPNVTGICKIPKGITIIDTFGFEATKLTTVVIPQSVKVINAQAFQNSSGLSYLDLPSDLTTLGLSVFIGCSKLTTINLPDSLTSIGYTCFYNCISLTSIDLPPNLVATTGLGYGVISNTVIPVANVTSRCSIYPVGSIGTVGYGCVFEEVGGVKKRAISAPKTFAGLGGSLDLAGYASGLTSIDAYAFQGCTLLTNLTLPSLLTSIGNYAFQGCSNITGLTLPSGLISIGSYSFSDTSNISGTITIPNATLSTYSFNGLGGAGTGVDIIISEGVSNIPNNCFLNCKLKSMTLPNTLRTIGDYAIGGNNALYTTLVIPEGVTSITAWGIMGGVLLTLTLPGTLVNFGASWGPGCVSNSITTLNINSGYNPPTFDFNYCFNFSQKLALTTATANALYTSMMNIVNGGPDTTLSTTLSGSNYICTVVSVVGFSVGMTVNIGGISKVLQAVYPASNQLQFSTTVFPSLPIGTLVTAKKIIHIGSTNKTNLIGNCTICTIEGVVMDLVNGFKQLNASNTTLSVATTNVAITSITVASTTGYLASGTIMLGTTSITYTSITSTTFVFASKVVPSYSIGTTVSEV